MRDDQPKHRQMRQEQRRVARRKASRAGLPAVLIVCEGRETEPNYIDGLRDHLRINAAAVHIEPGRSVTDPIGLVRNAHQRFFGVRALTERVRDIVGTSGVLLKTGIVRYCGHYVCDGLVSDVVILGRNYLRGFTSTYTALKARGRFETEFTNDTLA
jgi:hypothetical protein